MFTIGHQFASVLSLCKHSKQKPLCSAKFQHIHESGSCSIILHMWCLMWEYTIRPHIAQSSKPLTRYHS